MSDAATVDVNYEAWMADIHTTVLNEAERTGASPILVSATHLSHLMIRVPPVDALVLTSWSEHVAWLTGHLPRPRARRWDKATRSR